MEEGKIEDVKVENSQAPETKNYSEEDFRREYQELVERTGYRLNIRPVWSLTNHNTYELSIEATVGKID